MALKTLAWIGCEGDQVAFMVENIQFSCFSPPDVASVTNDIPETIATLDGILTSTNTFNDSTQQSKAIAQLATLRTAVKVYAQLHYSLEDWKRLHEGLHRLSMQIPAFVRRVSSNEVSLGIVREDWDTIKFAAIEPFFDSASLYTHLPSTIEMERGTEVKRSTDWNAELHELFGEIDKAMKNDDRKTLVLAILDLQTYVRQFISAANRELLKLAGELVRLSLILSGKLA
jgi:hypothetical protein